MLPALLICLKPFGKGKSLKQFLAAGAFGAQLKEPLVRVGFVDQKMHLNIVKGQLRGKLASPFNQAHGIGLFNESKVVEVVKLLWLLKAIEIKVAQQTGGVCHWGRGS